MECPSMVGKSQGKSCGGGRNGCWTCLYTGPEDKMLAGLIEQGDTSMVPLAEYKKLLYAIRNDARYRDPQRRLAYKQINKREDTLDQVNIADYDNKYSNSTFQRGFTSEYSPGSITFEGRKLLLQKLLYVEKVSGHHLIDTDEVEAIINCWIDEGYDVCHNAILPLDWQYDGPIVLHKDESINYSQIKTNNPTFVITVDFSDGSDEVIQFLQKRQYNMI